MRQYLIFGGECSKDFGLYISGSGAFNAPERDIETVEVPGRNGSLIIDNGRYKKRNAVIPGVRLPGFPGERKRCPGVAAGRAGVSEVGGHLQPGSFPAGEIRRNA